MLTKQGRLAAYEITIEDLRRHYPKGVSLEFAAQLVVLVLQIKLIGHGRFPPFVRALIILLAYLLSWLIFTPFYWLVAGAVLLGRWLFGKPDR